MAPSVTAKLRSSYNETAFRLLLIFDCCSKQQQIWLNAISKIKWGGKAAFIPLEQFKTDSLTF